MNSITYIEKLKKAFAQACGEANLVDRLVALDSLSKKLSKWNERAFKRRENIFESFSSKPEPVSTSSGSVSELIEAISSGIKARKVMDTSLKKIQTGLCVTQAASAISETALLKAFETLNELGAMPKSGAAVIFDAAKPHSRERLISLVP